VTLARIAAALERIAGALEHLAGAQEVAGAVGEIVRRNAKPAKKKRARPQYHPPRLVEVDDVSRARAARALRRHGLGHLLGPEAKKP
jgi:hypothetical protein